MMRYLGNNKLVFLIFVAVAGYFLWTEHQAHLSMAIPYLPYLLILLCPLMHIFMHHGHGHEPKDSSDGSEISSGRDERDPQKVATSGTRSLPRSGDRHD